MLGVSYYEKSRDTQCCAISRGIWMGCPSEVMKITRTDRRSYSKVRYYFDAVIAFLSFVGFVALASATFCYCSHFLKLPH
jgi:hypothetical protein